MKKKESKKLNSALLDSADVPDSVLDAARKEMANNQPETFSSPSAATAPVGNTGASGAKRSGGAVAVNKKIIAVCCACAVLIACIAVIITTMNSRPVSNASDRTISYDIADLEVQEISSVSQYNEENDTQFIAVNFGGTVTYAYSDYGEIVLFAQVFTYEDVQYIWYIAVDSDARFDILQDYVDTLETTDICGYTVCLNDEPCYAKFYAESSMYYLTGGTDSTAVTELLRLIIE